MPAALLHDHATVPTSTPPTASVGASSTAEASSAPELLYCENTAYDPTLGEDGSQLEALTDGSEAVVGTVITSFADQCSDALNLYSYSPDLSKQAAQHQEDGSSLAGYLPAGGGGFVNRSGQSAETYSDTPVQDGTPYFDPKTSELWWVEERHLWSVPVNGGTPEQHGETYEYGNGRFEAFSASGEPIVYPVATSPDGSLVAAYEKAKLVVGTPSTLTARCLNHETRDFDNYIENVGSCPGVAAVNFQPNPYHFSPCEQFIGLVSDTAFVCKTGNEHGERYDLYDLTLHGGHATARYATTLTPPTEMSLEESQLSPDGQTLWYIAVKHPLEPNTEASLYVIPTNIVSTNPTAVSFSPEDLLTSVGHVIGWRWHGQLYPAVADIGD